MLAGFRWIVEGRLAGAGRPGLLGSLERDIAFLRRERIGLVVTLTREPGVPIDGTESLHAPIDDMGIPTPRACEAACRRIVAAMVAGTRVLVHCRAGLGRTGLVAASTLVTLGRSAGEALAEVRRVHAGYVQSPAQERFLTHYEWHLRPRPDVPPAQRSVDLRPDPAWYAALGGDGVVQRVLGRFYDRVFADPRIGHHFARFDRATLAGKQFGFMKRCFTGERDVYMGQRPRNAHHWMVISDAEFDHRERLMRETLVEEGLTPAQVDRWIAVEEAFRRQIVKDRPVPLFYRGLETFWSETPREERIDVDTVCDACSAELRAQEPLWLTHDKVLCGGCAVEAAGA